MGKRVSPISVRKKIALAAILVAMLVAASVAYVVERRVSKLVIQDQVDLFDKEQKILTGEVASFFRAVESDVRTMASLPPIQGIIRASIGTEQDADGVSALATWTASLEDVFVDFAYNKDIYTQLRYIDTNGQELVRVNHTSNDTVVVAADDLQNKSNRYYFQDAMRKSQGEIYISPIDLNREGSPPKVEIPYNPVVRYGTPIFDSQKQERFGLLLVNVRLDEVFTALDAKANGDEDIILVNTGGEYIYHPDKSKTWGANANLNTGENLFNDFPDMASLFLDREGGYLRRDGKLFLYEPIFLDTANNHQITALRIIDEQALLAPVARIKTEIWLFLGVGVAVFILFLLYVLQNILRPIELLTNATRRIKAGDYTVSVPVKTKDEFGILSQVFNDMTSSLRDLYDRLDAKVHERTEQLIQAKAALEENIKDVNEAKQDLEKYQLAVAKSTDAVVITDSDARTIYTNEAAVSMTGYTSEEMLGVQCGKLWGGLMDEKFYEDMWHTIKEDKKPFKSEIKNKKKDGSVFYAEITITPIVNEQNQIEFYVEVMRDITETKEQQQEIARFKKAVDSAYEHIIITDSDGIIVYANTAVEAITGYKPKEIIGKKAGGKDLWGGLMDEKFYEDMWHTIKVKKQSFRGEIKNKRKDGTVYYADAIISPMLGDGGEVEFFIATERDVTRQKEMVKLKQEFELLSHRYSLAIQAAHIGVWDWDVVNNELEWDQQMYTLYGISPDDFSNAYEAWENTLHPDDKEETQTALQRALDNKEQFDIKFRIVWPNGSIHYIQAFALVLYGDDQKPVRMIGVNFDITEEEQIDKVKTEFVSLASHQLRTPLATINWYTEMLIAGDVGKITKAQKNYLEEIYAGSQRMVSLVNSLLNVSRLELGTFAVEPELLQLSELAEEVISEVRPMLESKHIALKKKYGKQLPEVQADPNLTAIIFQNLLTNAIKYTPEKGKIYLLIEDEKDSILISVKDNGMGIPADQQGNIFKKLFRADNARQSDTQGNGLGLYIIKMIVDTMGGKVWFESQEHNGSTFYVEFPKSGMRHKHGDKRIEKHH